MPDHYLQRRRSDGRNFFCPNGHSLSFGETENDRLRRERDRLKQQLAEKDDAILRVRDRADAAERSASARKGVITRLKNRAAAGVCPCCNRSFENLRRHMSNQHPTFSAQEVE
jgi:cell division septum initiation protein DivIVA